MKLGHIKPDETSEELSVERGLRDYDKLLWSDRIFLLGACESEPLERQEGPGKVNFGFLNFCLCFFFLKGMSEEPSFKDRNKEIPAWKLALLKKRGEK